jgi:hypothetical protein
MLIPRNFFCHWLDFKSRTYYFRKLNETKPAHIHHQANLLQRLHGDGFDMANDQYTFRLPGSENPERNSKANKADTGPYQSFFKHDGRKKRKQR